MVKDPDLGVPLVWQDDSPPGAPPTSVCLPPPGLVGPYGFPAGCSPYPTGYTNHEYPQLDPGPPGYIHPTLPIGPYPNLVTGVYQTPPGPYQSFDQNSDSYQYPGAYQNVGGPNCSNQSPYHQNHFAQSVVICPRQQQIPMIVKEQVSMVGATFLSCLVFWCCGSFIFGGIAFVLAMVGSSASSSGNSNEALRLKRASYALSIVGIIISTIIVAVLVGLKVHVAKQTSSSQHCYYVYNSLDGTSQYVCN